MYYESNNTADPDYTCEGEETNPTDATVSLEDELLNLSITWPRQQPVAEKGTDTNACPMLCRNKRTQHTEATSEQNQHKMDIEIKKVRGNRIECATHYEK